MDVFFVKYEIFQNCPRNPASGAEYTKFMNEKYQSNYMSIKKSLCIFRLTEI